MTKAEVTWLLKKWPHKKSLIMWLKSVVRSDENSKKNITLLSMAWLMQFTFCWSLN